MTFVETKVFRESWDVDQRLNQLDLTRKGLLEARDVAMNERANATDFHPANAPGTFGYHHGTWALRQQFVGERWVVDRNDGIETIQNDSLKLKIAFCNVDLACDDEHIPKPRSEKGSGAERASGTPLFGSSLPHYAPRLTGDPMLYYLMVDQNGAAELTRPVVSGGTFLAAVERIYLSSGDDDDPAVLGEDTGPVDNFDPQVVRR